MTNERKEDLLVALCDVLKDLVKEFDSLVREQASLSGVEPFALKRAKIVLRRAELNR